MTYTCGICGDNFNRSGKRKAHFCSMECKAEAQRQSKGITKEWLFQKYITEQLGTYEISKLVNRNPKRVYEWLIGYGIPTRTKNESIVAFNKRPETREKRGNSRRGIKMTDIQKEKISIARTGKHYPNLQGSRNGMFGRTGNRSGNWKGGCTPERQAFYSSLGWKNVLRFIWGRDKGVCKRCGDKKQNIHIHHIISFAHKKTRVDRNNLITFCQDCHLWIHSKNNTNKEFIIEYN